MAQSMMAVHSTREERWSAAYSCYAGGSQCDALIAASCSDAVDASYDRHRDADQRHGGARWRSRWRTHTCCRSTWRSGTSRFAQQIAQDRVQMPPLLQDDFLTLLGAALHRPCVRPLMWLSGPRAVCSSNDAGHIGQRAWFAKAPTS